MTKYLWLQNQLLPHSDNLVRDIAEWPKCRASKNLKGDEIVQEVSEEEGISRELREDCISNNIY